MRIQGPDAATKRLGVEARMFENWLQQVQSRHFGEDQEARV